MVYIKNVLHGHPYSSSLIEICDLHPRTCRRTKRPYMGYGKGLVRTEYLSTLAGKVCKKGKLGKLKNEGKISSKRRCYIFLLTFITNCISNDILVRFTHAGK